MPTTATALLLVAAIFVATVVVGSPAAALPPIARVAATSAVGMALTVVLPLRR
jgi:hypothetical protein